MEYRLAEQLDELQEEQRNVMAEAAKESQKREFQFFEKAREAHSELVTTRERLRYIESGAKCEDEVESRERRAFARAEEVEAAERSRIAMETQAASQAESQRARERELSERLKDMEAALSAANAQLSNAFVREQEAIAREAQLRERLDLARLTATAENLDEQSAVTNASKESNEQVSASSDLNMSGIQVIDRLSVLHDMDLIDSAGARSKSTCPEFASEADDDQPIATLESSSLTDLLVNVAGKFSSFSLGTGVWNVH